MHFGFRFLLLCLVTHVLKCDCNTMIIPKNFETKLAREINNKISAVTEAINRLRATLAFNADRKEQFIKYLRRISGSKTISGLYVNCHQLSSKGVNTIRRIASVYPGIISTPIPSYLASSAKWNSFTKEIISNWNNGHLIRMHWTGSPLSSIDFFTNANDSKEIERKWNDWILDGGKLNKEWKKNLDTIVPHLQKLETAGVLPIFDILPFISAKYYIWSERPGENGTRDLYKLTHDYLTKHHKLNFLIWNWSLDSKYMSEIEDYWPGSEYVDVASVYMFNKKELAKNEYEKLTNVVGDTPLSMEDIYSVPATELIVRQPQWTWFTANDIKLNKVKYNNNESLKSTFNAKTVINRGDIIFL